MAIFALRDGELPSAVVGTGFIVFALVFGGFGLRTLWGWVRNEQTNVEINECGVVEGTRLWPWERIRSFTGTRYDNGVALGFILRDKTVQWRRGSLPTTPLLTEQQYVELARQLSEVLATRFPHVEVALHPLRPTDP